MKHRYLHTTMCTLAVVAMLASCRTTVPQPTKALSVDDQSNKYQWVNNAPLRASHAQSVYFSDLNKDGDIDLLLGSNNKSNGFHVEWGDGTGNWVTQSGPPTSMMPLSFATADINHNNNINILIGGKGAQKGLQVWELSNDTKTWILHSSPISSGTFSAVKFADINNDGWDDIVATRLESNENGGVLLLLNNGQNGWVSGTSPVAKGVFTGLAVEDLNGDGNLDIITSRRGGLGAIEDSDDVWTQVGGIQLWHGDGNGRWQPAELPTSSDAESLTIADIDGDGDLDIIAGLYQEGITMWLNNDGSWDKGRIISTGTWSDIRVADLDADGQRELIASSNVDQGLRIWHWRNGSFNQDHRITPNFGTYLDIDLGDIRKDGTLSIAAIRAGAGIEVWSSQKPSPLPALQFTGAKVGEPMFFTFASGHVQLDKEQQLALQGKLLGIIEKRPLLHFEIIGFPDLKPIHSDLYPNDTALALGRAESIAQWLLVNNFDNIDIQTTAHSANQVHTAPPSKKIPYSSVLIQAYSIETSRLPSSTARLTQKNLFQVTENDVFKTIDGIPEYKVGSGDELSVTFWQGSKADTKKVTIQIDGTISLPYQAALNVSGKTPREIDQLITGILQTFERNPRVDVQVLKARSKHASIFGEINSLSRQPTGPGSYNLKGKESLVDFLSRAGGPNKEANLHSVQITRGGKTIVLNLDRAIRLGDMSENAIIDDGDTIFIPSIKQSKRQIYVLGEVNKKGIVEFTGDINFLDALSKSGGLTPNAYLPDIRVLRANREQPEILAVDFERFMEQGDLSQNIALMDKDIIIIPARPIANWNKYIADISPSITLLLQPVSIAQQLLTLQALSGQLK